MAAKLPVCLKLEHQRSVSMPSIRGQTTFPSLAVHLDKVQVQRLILVF
jgi:hypothetical protein